MQDIYGATLKISYVFNSTEEGNSRFKALHKRVIEHVCWFKKSLFHRIFE